MNILFIIEDGKCSTFFLATMTKNKKIQLLRIAPTYQIQGSSIESFFLTDTREIFLKRVNESFVEVSAYLIVNQEVILQACFDKNTTCHLSNSTIFTRNIQETAFIYEKGVLHLTKEQVREFFRFVEGQNIPSLFDRQEQLVRMLKNNNFNGKKTLEMVQVLHRFYPEVETNITWKKGIEFFFAYQKRTKNKVKRTDFY